MIREIEGIPVVVEMDHRWSQRTSELRRAYRAARSALNDLVHVMSEHGIEMDQGDWLEVVREMAAANVYDDACKVDRCLELHNALKITDLEAGGIRADYVCPEHGWHACWWSPTAPFRW